MVVTQSGEVLIARGVIKVEVNSVVENITQGKHIHAGSILFIEDSAEISIAYEDGSAFHQTQHGQIVDNNEISDAAEIAQLQDLISAGNDPTALLPETAAGSGLSNEGESHFISVGRTGYETIAAAGYSTIGTSQGSLDTTKRAYSSDIDASSTLESDSNTIAEDTIATGNVLNNDADIDNDLSVVSFEVDGSIYISGTLAMLNDGSLVLNSDGSYTFTPNENWNGTVPVITYTVNTGLSSTLNINVTPVDDDFTDNNEVLTIAEDSPEVNGNVIDGSSVDGDISVTSFTVDGDNTVYQADGSDITIANVGTFSLNSQGDYTFTPAANYNGTVPVITYSLTDGSSAVGSSDETSTLSINVTPVNDDFTDNNEVLTIAEDSPEVNGNVIDGTS
ncbi:retention module-containing protein, partial [Shewanella sp.]|uniref:retention module-containing protein n=1 Tax=Shewanella sp. TaxID=50422 RepID=UPI00258270CB